MAHDQQFERQLSCRVLVGDENHRAERQRPMSGGKPAWAGDLTTRCSATAIECRATGLGLAGKIATAAIMVAKDILRAIIGQKRGMAC
jgi:hypothetical protein